MVCMQGKGVCVGEEVCVCVCVEREMHGVFCVEERKACKAAAKLWVAGRWVAGTCKLAGSSRKGSLMVAGR